MKKLLGDFSQDKYINIEEADIVKEIFINKNKKKGMLVDVGACQGGVLKIYAEMGWDVIAFEPNPENYNKLIKNTARLSNIKTFQLAISDSDDQILNFYTSEESVGISSLVPFTEGHKLLCTVKTKKLSSIIKELQIKEIDFLKIDAEGFDYVVLESLEWVLLPNAILLEFDGGKEIPGNRKYNFADMADYLQKKGYQVFVSEWYPIKRYGVKHSFKALKCYPCEVSAKSWGNIIAFKDAIDENEIIKAYKKQMSLKKKLASLLKIIIYKLKSIKYRD